ncbi:hypothetical protein niasHT_029839 [Heterodera trifolii]|uniref:Uncharacterized protein n=1 Tax=Heterodera trifolii TaxID=157864 RepID=A0ABD2K0R7_9BILA
MCGCMHVLGVACGSTNIHFMAFWSFGHGRSMNAGRAAARWDRRKPRGWGVGRKPGRRKRPGGNWVGGGGVWQPSPTAGGKFCRPRQFNAGPPLCCSRQPQQQQGFLRVEKR